MRIVGNIYKVNLASKIIAIKSYNRLIYFYFQNSQMNLFKRYLYEGIYIDLDYDENKTFIKRGINAYIVNFINQIYHMGIYKRIKYFDRKEINSSLSKFLSSLGNVMFLDLEMTMPNYGFSGKEFKAEIIQAGYLILDVTGEEICRYSNYIKPVLQHNIGARALKFLNLDNTTFNSKAIKYEEFYEEFKMMIELYHPAIIVYGKNDSIILNNSFKINNVQPITEGLRFVNLCKLIKNFYNLKNEAGLFKLYQIYYENSDLQVHDAFNDCYVTKEVFNAFKDEVNHKTDFSFKIHKYLD